MVFMITLLLVALAFPAAATCTYLVVLTALSRAGATPPRSSRQLCFDIIVPAHDEVSVLGTLLASLRRLDWPSDRYRVLVVADNCTDGTAALARAADVGVLERHDPSHHGKGYALDAGFAASSAFGWADAVVIVDADSAVSAGLLEAFAIRIERGAEAVQAHYSVLNAGMAWRTRLMSIALGSFHRVRSRARERLRLSCGLRGNGWCVTRGLLRQVPYRAFSLAEDVEYGIDLGLAGNRVHYADEAEVAGIMVSGEYAARAQRQRWESGRLQLIRTRLGPLFRGAFGPDPRVCLDLAMDLLVMPLSYVALIVAALLVVAGLGTLADARLAPWLWLGIGCGTGLLAYVLRGWQLSDVGVRGLVDLARAPWFVLWKSALTLRPHDSTKWVRTKRGHE
jgi:cellulose synthase/poly-beta-1,6-N-acetylglucosamine synthase-like glycosyltransferase